jgi:hypothetical protein
LAYFVLIPTILILLVLAMVARIRRRRIVQRRFLEIQSRKMHFIEAPPEEASWEDAARVEAERFRLLGIEP